MFKRKIFITFFISLGLLCNIGNAYAAPAADQDKNITIVSKDDVKGCYYEGATGSQTWTNERCFKDDKLAEIAFQAITDFYAGNPSGTNVTFTNNPDGSITFNNTNMRAILAAFRGDIDANWRSGEIKIKSIKGVQFLTHANTINLKKNDIEDLTELNVSLINSSAYLDDHYGYGPGEDPDDATNSISRNVIWHLEGNPFRKLPYALGGRLVIAQPASVSSNYPDDEEQKFYFMRDDAHPDGFSGELSIKRSEIMMINADGNPIDKDGNVTSDASKVAYRDVNISAINFVNATDIKLDTTKGDADPAHPGNKFGYTTKIAFFKDLKYSRKQAIGIGADQEIRYVTVDEFDTATPGSQSFKYYIEPTFYVYDSVAVTTNVGGSVELTKVDATNGNPLEGAVYTLYRGDTIVQDNLTTDQHGIIKITGLKKGDYSLKETKAPTNYEVSSDPVNFHIDVAHIAISGGTKSVTTSDTTTEYKAEHDQTFIAGNLNDDIVLTQNGVGVIEEVTVTYAELNDGVTITNDKVSTFTNIADAQVEINQYKNNGHIFGKVTVDVTFKDVDSTEVKLSHENTLLPSTDKPKNPDTSDDSNMNGWIMLAITSLCLMGFAVHMKNKKV